MTGKRFLIVTLAWLLSCSFAAAQDVSGTGPNDQLDEASMTEALKRFMDDARQRRLGLERKQVTAEIEQGLLFDPSKIVAVVKELSAGAKNTWADNADRICKAFAMVDRRFGKAWGLLEGGSYEAAAQAAKPLISVRDTTYFAAAKRFCYARALEGMGRDQDAVEAYTELVKDMPDRFSFSALALLNAGRTYERMHRRYYAMSLYQLWVESFGLLDPETAEQLATLADQIAADYSDPLGALAGKMSDVAKRLSEVDSGRSTQKRQKEIVAMLDDLITTAEESSSSQSQSQGQGKQGQGECPSCGKKGCGGECSGQGKGGKQGPASGIGIPSSPATVSRLVGGAVLRPEGLSEIRPSDATDDWGRLPPRERAKLLETFKDAMPERYRDMIRDYYKRLASQEPR